MDIINEAKQIINTEITALESLKESLNGAFEKIVNEIYLCQNNIIITGIGKSGHICKKIAATMSSLGTPMFYLHPSEALHGDLGMITANDIVIAVSNSGETEEIIGILDNIKLIGAKIIAISSNPDSTLVKHSDLSYVLPKVKEACQLNLAPTSSTTATLVLGDAIAVALSKLRGFREEDFALYHPSGALGKKLLVKVEDVMISGEENALIMEGASLKDTIVELSKKGLGIVSIIDGNHDLKGVFTDGDLRRIFMDIGDIDNIVIDTIMNQNPVSIAEDRLAVDALNLMKNYTAKGISALPVTKNGKIAGTILLRTLIKEHIVT